MRRTKNLEELNKRRLKRKENSRRILEVQNKSYKILKNERTKEGSRKARKYCKYTEEYFGRV